MQPNNITNIYSIFHFKIKVLYTSLGLTLDERELKEHFRAKFVTILFHYNADNIKKPTNFIQDFT